jgi:superfamily I DNA/RNA helicase
METWWREPGELDPDQQGVIELPPEGSFLVLGPPGSGKTNLLLLRASYLAQSEHPNLAVIVFTRTLQEFIRSGAENYDFDPRVVQTSRLLFDRLLEEAGRPHEPLPDFDEDRKARLAAVQSVVGMSGEPLYDVLLIDEAQDFLLGEIQLFRRLARDVFMVGDSRQQIYGGGLTLADLRSAVDETKILRFHYRSGRPICSVADGIGRTFSAGYEAILPTCNYNSAAFQPSVDIFRGNIPEQAAAIAHRLSLQRRAYPEGFLGVICPRGDDVKTLATALRDAGFGDQLCVQDREDGYRPFDPAKPIWVSTVHSAKGLEFRALHFAGADTVVQFRAEQKRLAYTGITRAKTALTVYHEGLLPPYFDSALNAVRPAQASRVSLGAAFGRR